jgi:hypothetical protein
MRRSARRLLARATVQPTLVITSLALLAAAVGTFPAGSRAASDRGGDAGHIRSSYSLSLEVSDSSVTAADAPNLQIEAENAFTVTFWTFLRRIDVNDLPRFWEKGGDFLCVMGDRSNPRYGTIGLEVANASGVGNVNGGASEFWGRTRLQTGRWYFVAVTFDGNKASGQAQIYLDGNREKMSTIYPWSGRLGSTSRKPWFIGRRAKDFSRGLAGRLDSMLVYPFALSAAQVQQIHQGRVPRGVTADWEFDEGAGSVAKDSSGHDNDATLVNAVFAPR